MVGDRDDVATPRKLRPDKLFWQKIPFSCVSPEFLNVSRSVVIKSTRCPIDWAYTLNTNLKIISDLRNGNNLNQLRRLRSPWSLMQSIIPELHSINVDELLHEKRSLNDAKKAFSSRINSPFPKMLPIIELSINNLKQFACFKVLLHRH